MRRRSECGQSLVETALVTTFILVPLLIGLVAFAPAFYSYIAITNAAREGARAASRLSCYPSDAAQRAVYRGRIIQIVRDEVTGSAVPPGDLMITIVPEPNSRCALGAEEIRVSVSYLYTPIVSGVLGIGPITMSSSTSMARMGETGK